jgi:hypothetical protein
MSAHKAAGARYQNLLNPVVKHLALNHAFHRLPQFPNMEYLEKI